MIVSGSITAQQLSDFTDRMRDAAAGMQAYFASAFVPASITVQTSPDSTTSYQVNLTDQRVDGQAVTVTNGDRVSGHADVPLEWAQDPQFIADYVKTVLAHEFGHMMGLAQSTCGSSIMADTILASYTWFTDCDYAFATWWYQNGAPSCHLMPPCGQNEFMDDDGCCYNQEGSPILLSLDAGPIRLSSPQYGVDFDVFGTGTQFRVAWPLNPTRNAWLALDRDGDGQITSGGELFGDATFMADGSTRAPNGFVALAQYDVNGDWRIDTRDPVFAQLRLWADTNRDGVSRPEELYPLPAFGIESIDLQYRASERTDSSGNEFRYRSQVGASIPPMVRFAYDVYLAVRPIR